MVIKLSVLFIEKSHVNIRIDIHLEVNIFSGIHTPVLDDSIIYTMVNKRPSHRAAFPTQGAALGAQHPGEAP